MKELALAGGFAKPDDYLWELGEDPIHLAALFESKLTFEAKLDQPKQQTWRDRPPLL